MPYMSEEAIRRREMYYETICYAREPEGDVEVLRAEWDTLEAAEYFKSIYPEQAAKFGGFAYAKIFSVNERGKRKWLG